MNPDLKRLETLNRVLRALLDGGDVDAVLDRIMGEVISLLHAERGYLVLGQRMEVRAVRNWRREEIAGEGGEVSRSIVKDVLEAGAPVLLENALDSRFGDVDSVQTLQLRSILAAPLRSPDQAQPAGVVYLESRAELARFGRNDAALLVEILDLAGKVLADVVKRHTLEERSRRLESAFLARHRFPGIVTSEPAMIEVLKMVSQLANSDAPVLILGESGTGKELIARALHLNSPRAEQPFIVVNCGALSETVLESELFGHVKGAFTGALRDRAGMIESAENGTLFLDEVGEMPPSLQVKLLRTLQFGEYKPVGSDHPRSANVRFVSATHRNLEEAVTQGQFRQDLLYRINSLTLEIPPLRERVDDIPLLFRHFVEKIMSRSGTPARDASPALMDALVGYAWPGNVRELENEVERVVALSGGSTGPLEPAALSQRVRERGSRPDPRHLSVRVDEQEKESILEALDREGGNRTRAAKRLGVSRETLRIKMRKHGL
jgi:Nif-specific regulatory protein/two-component system response regulator HydG